MFDDLIEKKPKELDIAIEKMCCEECEYASYILSNYPGKKILCQLKGYHKSYDYWCEKWSQRERVKPHGD